MRPSRRTILRVLLIGVAVVGLTLAITAATEGGRRLLRAQLQRVTDKIDATLGRWLDRNAEDDARETSLRNADGDGLVFLHHSCGADWLSSGLHLALLGHEAVETVRSITYEVDVPPDDGRPDSLQGEHPPGNYTDMRHWLSWFNDYLGSAKRYGRTSGEHRVVIFKSCYPNSNIQAHEGPVDPLSEHRSVANYQAVFRHPDGPRGVYQRGDAVYRPLEQVFAEHPETLFIAVTAPPRHYGPPDATTDEEAARARAFNHWLENDWLNAYRQAHPGLDNVAVYNWWAFLAYPADHPHHPGRLMYRYGGSKNDSHPNRTADKESVPDFLQWFDGVWSTFRP